VKSYKRPIVDWIDTPGLDYVMRTQVSRATVCLNPQNQYQPVLLLGPTGSGKSYVRDKILSEAGYPEGQCEFLNCAEFAENLIESELFGHVTGAFTGAINKKRGVFKDGGEGLVVLDEIDSFEKHVQAKLLRVLETGDFKIMGDEKPSNTNQRVLAISNSKIADNLFRPDFLHRFLKVSIPPLHNRRIDILVLLHKLAPDVLWTRNDIFRLLCYNWPGNVRELSQFAKLAQYHADGIKAFESERGGKGVLFWFHAFSPIVLGFERPDEPDIPSFFDLLSLQLRLSRPPWSDFRETLQGFCPLVAPSSEKDVFVDLSSMDNIIGLRHLHNRYDEVESREKFLFCWRVDWEDFCALFGQDPCVNSDILYNIMNGEITESRRCAALHYLNEERGKIFHELGSEIRTLLKKEKTFKGTDLPNTHVNLDEAVEPLDTRDEFESAVNTLVPKMSPRDYQDRWAAYWAQERDKGVSLARIAKDNNIDKKTLDRWFKKHEASHNDHNNSQPAHI